MATADAVVVGAGVIGSSVGESYHCWASWRDHLGIDGAAGRAECYYVAMGTRGNQFKNAPLAGLFIATLVECVEAGHDHDADPIRYTGEHTGQSIDLGAFSRKRAINAASTFTVSG